MALKQLLELKSSTSKAIPYSEWETQPNIIFEMEQAKNFYNEISGG